MKPFVTQPEVFPRGPATKTPKGNIPKGNIPNGMVSKVAKDFREHPSYQPSFGRELDKEQAIDVAAIDAKRKEIEKASPALANNFGMGLVPPNETPSGCPQCGPDAVAWKGRCNGCGAMLEPLGKGAKLNILDDAPQASTNNNDIKQAVALAKAMSAMEDDIEKDEAALAIKKAALRKIETELLPDLMTALGLATFKLENGESVTIKPILTANLPAKGAIEKADDEERPLLEERLEAGLKWLRANKASDLIKNQIKIDAGKGQDAKVKKLLALAEKLNLVAECSETVNPQTLSSFVKEQMAIPGKIIPMDTFAVYQGNKAVIKAATVAKPKKEKQ